MSAIPPIEEIITEEALAALPEDQRESWQRLLDDRAKGHQRIADALNAGDFHEAMILSDSQQRGPILARAGRELEGEALRKIIEDWWSVTEAWGGDPELREGVMSALRKAAPVLVPLVPSDDTQRHQKPPEGRFRVYRGNLGETPHGGSWSLSRATAEFFARMAASPRGELVLGMSGPGPASVWQGWVEADDVLGFFDDRGEYEIVTDHVYDIEKIAELVPVEEAS